MKDKMNLKKVADTFIWVCVVGLTGLAFFLTYYLHLMGPVKAIVWLGWLVASLAMMFFTAKGQQVFVFGKESKNELQKVVWPNRQETIQTTSIVMLMVVIAGFVLWGVDVGMMWMIGKITHLG
jgi:preprotein translocase subunit SecE